MPYPHRDAPDDHPSPPPTVHHQEVGLTAVTPHTETQGTPRARGHKPQDRRPTSPLSVQETHQPPAPRTTSDDPRPRSVPPPNPRLSQDSTTGDTHRVLTTPGSSSSSADFKMLTRREPPWQTPLGGVHWWWSRPQGSPGQVRHTRGTSRHLPTWFSGGTGWETGGRVEPELPVSEEGQTGQVGKRVTTGCVPSHGRSIPSPRVPGENRRPRPGDPD